MSERITATMLCRALLHLAGPPANLTYRAYGAPKGVETSQSYTKARIPHGALAGTIDDVIGEFLVPCVAPLVARLVQKNAGFSYDLPLTSRAQSSARCMYSGLAMRCVQLPIFSDAVLGDFFVPQADWPKFTPIAYDFRFDVLHSPRLAVAA